MIERIHNRNWVLVPNAAAEGGQGQCSVSILAGRAGSGAWAAGNLADWMMSSLVLRLAARAVGSTVENEEKQIQNWPFKPLAQKPKFMINKKKLSPFIFSFKFGHKRITCFMKCQIIWEILIILAKWAIQCIFLTQWVVWQNFTWIF